MMKSIRLQLRAMCILMAAAGLVLAAAGCGSNEGRKARHVEQGEKFMAERNYAKALLEFRNALQIDPKDARVREMTGLAAEYNGDFELAADLYRVALAADGSLVTARAHLARFMALGGAPDEAMDLVTTGLRQTPQSADLLSARAIVHVQQGDLAAARKDAEEAVAADPRNTDAVTVLASILWRENQREEAVALLSKAVSADPDEIPLRLSLAQLLVVLNQTARAEEQLVEIVRLDPENYDHRARLVQVYLLQGKSDQAISTARAAVQMHPDSRDAKIAFAQMLASLRSFSEAEQALAGFLKESPEDVDLLLDVGGFYEANGRHAEAERTYLHILELDPTQAQNLTAQSRLAALKLRGGQHDEAARYAEAILAESPSDARGLVTRAEQALQRGDTTAAIVDLRSALGNEPDSVPLATALARAHLQAGEVELAEQTLRRLVQLAPNDVEARLALAQFLVDRGRVQEAQPVVEQLVAEQPANVTALTALARLQLASRDPDAALRSASTIQALQPAAATGYLLAGQIQESERRVEAAREAFELAAEMDPNAIEPLAALARLDNREGQPERTLPLVERRIEATPQNALLYLLRGEILLAMERPAEAASSFKMAAEKQPALVAAHRGLARSHIEADQRELAVAALRKGLEATSGSPRIGLQLAAVLAEQGRVDEAIAVSEELLARNPREDVVANDLAMLLVNRRSDAASLERAASLVERFADSTNPAFLDTRGWVLYKQGKFQEAVEVLENAVARAPALREIRYHLGLAQLKSGKPGEARQNLELAVAAGPDYEGIEVARAALDDL